MSHIGLPPVESLHRLEEFVEPWELMCVDVANAFDVTRSFVRSFDTMRWMVD